MHTPRTHPRPAAPPKPGDAPAAPSPQPFPRALQVLFFCILTLIATTLYTARILHPGPDSGEFWSDANVINGCRGFDQAGLGATWGIPRLELAAPTDEKQALYLTYPPAPYWFTYAAWSLGQAMGIDPVLAARLFAQTCGLASAVLAFLLFSRLTHSRGLGALAALFYILSAPFLSLSAALHHMAYSPMLLFGAMLAWLAFERGGPRRALWLALTGALFAADCWMNFEHMVFFALFVGVRTALHFRLPVVLGAALIGPIPIPMMALRVLHNAQVMGGWDSSLRMFLTRARDRSGAGRLRLDSHELAHTWLGRLGWPWADVNPARQFWNGVFAYPVLTPLVLAGVAACLLWLLLQRRTSVRSQTPAEPGRSPRPAPTPPPRLLLWTLPAPLARQSPAALGLANGLLLLAGGLTWFVVMTQHTFPHRFIVLLLMPGLALLLGTLAWSALAAAHAPRPAPARQARRALPFAGALVACLVLAFAWEARRTDVLNHLLPLDDAVHRMVSSRAQGNAHAAAASQALSRRGVARVTLYDGANAMPWRGASIHLPFRFARGRRVPIALAPDEALYLEAYDPQERAACLDSVERFGLPASVGGPDARTFIFRPREARLGADTLLGVPLTPSLTLHSMRRGRSLDGSHLAVALWITGDLDAPHEGPGPAGPPPPPAPDAPKNPGTDDPAEAPQPTVAPLERFAFTLRVRAQHGRELAKLTTRIEWTQVRDDGRAMLVLALPVDRLPAGGSLELAVWDRREGRAVALGASPPPALTTDPQGRTLRWPISQRSRRE